MMRTTNYPTALIADDEPLLRDALARQLAQAWPELRVVAQARNGREAIEQFDAKTPDICFLDVHMPGLSGVEAASRIGRRAHLVFVTAYDQYAVQAFAQGALDYLVKPVEMARLTDTVARLQERQIAALPAIQTEALLQQLAAQLRRNAPPPPLNWIYAQMGQIVRVIAADQIDYLRSDTKYTTVCWRDNGQPAEALVRAPLKQLLAQLDAADFLQIHRAVAVNLHAVSHITRVSETGTIYLKHRPESLPVSRTFMHLFRQM